MSFEPIDLKIFDAGAMASTNTIYSTSVNVRRLRTFGVHAVWTGTPTGAFTFWCSSVINPSTADDTDWVQLTLSSAPSDPAGSASKWATDFVDFPWRHFRVKYVNASGTGTLNAYFTGKA